MSSSKFAVKDSGTKAAVVSRRGTLVLLAVLFAGAHLLTWAGEAEEPQGKPLDVMSFNIRYGTANDGENSWDHRREMVVDVLRRHEPDVVGLQEALLFQIEEILEALPGYAMIGAGRDDGKLLGEFSAILFRRDRLIVDRSGTFWLSDTPEEPGSITWGNACTRVCTWARFIDRDAGEAFYLFNTHFDHVSQYSRDRSVVLLARRIRDRAHKDPVILTGDLNAAEDNPAVQYLKGEKKLPVGNPPQGDRAKNPGAPGLVDTFRVLHPDASDVGTFNGFAGRTSGAKIDYVFVQPGVKVLEAAILHDNEDGRYPSDHFPVTARLLLD